MTYNRFNLRQLIGRSLGIDRPNPQLWGLIVREYGGVSRLLAALDSERITYLSLPGLKSSGVIPNDTLGQIEQRKLENLANNLYLNKAFDELSGYLSQAEIPHVRIKGLDLIRDFYNDPSVRPISDIDILVKPTQFGLTIQLLLEKGFCKTHSGRRLPGVWPAANLIRADSTKPVWVDLHYCLGPAVGDRAKHTLKLFRDLSPDKPLPSEYRTVILATHYQNHFMEMPLISYYELIQLVRASDSQVLFDLAKKWNAADALRSALNRAAWLFGTPAPYPINVKNDILRYLSSKALREPHGGFSGVESLIYLLSLDNPGAAIRFGTELLYKKILTSL